MAHSVHAGQRVEPERVDLDRLANPRRDHPIADLGVHPGELHARLAGVEQTVVRVNVNVMAGAAQVMCNDPA